MPTAADRNSRDDRIMQENTRKQNPQTTDPGGSPDPMPQPDPKQGNDDRHPDTAPSQLRRLGQILRILKKHKVTRGMDPVKFRQILEDLGPTYVKIGQIMATRQDIFSQRYCSELEKLRSDVKPMPFETVKEVLTEAYGPDLDKVFTRIDETPLGSASIAQVHKAWLKDGPMVVVKVQRPGIYQEMEEDIRLLRKASGILKLSDVFSSVVDVNVVLDEFWTSAQQEMDFTNEAQNAMRFRRDYEDCAWLSAPVVYEDLTSRKVMVMEYISGCEIDDDARLDAEGYDRHEIAMRLGTNYITQITEFGFFHADPHSGNIRVRDGQIVYIDFGMMGTLTDRDRRLMKQAIKALAVRDTLKLTDTILTLGVVKRPPDYANLTQSIEEYVSIYCENSLEDIDLPAMVQDLFTICHEYGIALPKGISMLARSLVTFEGTIEVLDPSTNAMKIISTQKASLLSSDWGRDLQHVLTRLQADADHMLNMPVQLSDILSMVRRGQLKVNLDLQGADSTIANFDRMINRIIVCLLIVALLMSSSIICTTKMKPEFLGIPLLGFAGFFIAFCMSMWLFVKMLFLHQKNKPF
ncbi:ABC1 kinase family protein [Faecalibaculum rodentium]|jgi:ubiquinone biosynthesis protein|uniref:ABC1 kinase family protein n=2 Tax=Faecalibaculum rodentium TaxID=1702221 RepID=UPI0023F23086|nr:AarF/UbiB family protein [Faecalibaculum rodentium]